MSVRVASGNGPISFGDKLAGSGAFKTLFKDGMGLVEEAAAYLDGPGRVESKTLGRSEALAYASESMRLTTRLMQIASWLLLQRAVNEGEMTPQQAATEKHRVKLARQEIASRDDVYERLPETLRSLVARSLRLQDRVIHLDQLLYRREPAPALPPPPPPVALQRAMLQHAFRHRMAQ